VAYSTLLPLGRDKETGDTVLAWPNAVREVVDAFTLPGRVMQGERPSPREVTEMALEFGFLGGPVGAATVPRGSLGMFAGKSAKTADMDALAKAKQMEQAGESARDIWNQTGWFKGADGEWRFEIDDSQARFVAEKPGEYDKARQVMDHPGLYEAYLRPGGGSVGYDQISRFGEPGGSYTPSPQRYTISARGPEDARSAMLHEQQHAIQEQEHFARGGSPERFRAVLDRVGATRQDANDALVLKGMQERFNLSFEDAVEKYKQVMERGPSGKAQLLAQYNDRDNLRNMLDPQAAYERLAGEVEARNVQTRRDMTPNQRRETPPWETEDVLRQYQIIDRGE
jgi:hypothetical protein